MAGTYGLWFRKKYNLAPTDPRYLRATAEMIEAEWWAYNYEDSKVTEEFEDPDFDLAAESAKILAEAEADEAARLESAALVTPENVDDWEDID
jgi:hypothetical protein